MATDSDLLSYQNRLVLSLSLKTFAHDSSSLTDTTFPSDSSRNRAFFSAHLSAGSVFQPLSLSVPPNIHSNNPTSTHAQFQISKRCTHTNQRHEFQPAGEAAPLFFPRRRIPAEGMNKMSTGEQRACKLICNTIRKDIELAGTVLEMPVRSLEEKETKMHRERASKPRAEGRRAHHAGEKVSRREPGQ